MLCLSKSADPDQTQRRRRGGWSRCTLFAYVRRSLFAWRWPFVPIQQRFHILLKDLLCIIICCYSLDCGHDVQLRKPCICRKFLFSSKIIQAGPYLTIYMQTFLISPRSSSDQSPHIRICRNNWNESFLWLNLKNT